MLNQDYLHEVFHYTQGNLIWRNSFGKRGKAGTAAGTLHHSGYIQIRIHGQDYRAHRLIWTYHHGDTFYEVEHRNGVPDDNRIENLRLATCSENGANKPKRAGLTSAYKGVCRHAANLMYRAQIKKNGKVYYLGQFHREKDAAVAYNKAALELHGEFACLNVL